MREYEQRLQEHQVEIKVVTFDHDSLAQAYVKQTQLTWPLLLDTDRVLYRGYAMERASFWTLYNPRSIFRYLKLIFQGHLPDRPGSDTQQLGGDVVIDPSGFVRMHHVSHNPHDRPSIESLLELVY